MKLFIATPTASGLTTTGYAHTLSYVHSAVQKLGGTCRLATCDGASVAIARNILVSEFLATDDADQLLFVDSDIKVDAHTVDRILNYSCDACGAIYPRRSLNMGSIKAAFEDGKSFKEAINAGLKFDVVLAQNDMLEPKKFLPVSRIGLGFFKVTRGTLWKMVDQNIVQSHKSWAAHRSLGTERVYDFFSEIPLGEGDHLGEDYSFCKRILSMDRAEIMGYASSGISHQGLFDFKLHT